MSSTKHALAFINPAAGGSKPDQIQQALTTALELAGHSVAFTTLEKKTGPVDLIPQLQQASQAGTTLVIACGGDGTVSCIASAIIASGCSEKLKLGIIPAGTANILSKELGIPSDWNAAAQMLASTDHSIPLDAMLMDDRYYFLRIGIGIDAETISSTDRESKRLLGRWAYFKSFLGQVFNPSRVKFRCIIDGKKRRFWAVQVFLANGGSIALAPFPIGPGISLSDGVLNLCAYDALNWRDYFTVGWRLLRKDYHKHPLLKFYTVKKNVTIQSRAPLPVQGDGEPISQTPVTITVVPAAIQVIAGSLDAK